MQASSRARREEGVFVCEGVRVISEIAESDLISVFASESFYNKNRDEAETLFARAREGGQITSDRVFEKMSDTKSPQGILALAKISAHDLPDVLTEKEMVLQDGTVLEKGIRLLILEHLQNPGNLGSFLRSGEAAGMTGVILSRDSVDLYNPKVIRASMGSFLRIPCVYVDDLEGVLAKCDEMGVCTYAMRMDADQSCYDVHYPSRIALIIGNEGNGLSENVTKWASAGIRIPMAGKAESLNAANAATALFFEILRQKITNQA